MYRGSGRARTAGGGGGEWTDPEIGNGRVLVPVPAVNRRRPEAREERREKKNERRKGCEE